MIIGGIFGFYSVIKPTSLLLLGTVWLEGSKASIYYLLSTAVSLYVGVGFLKQLSGARQVFIYWSIFGLANSFIGLFTAKKVLYMSDINVYGSARDAVYFGYYAVLIVVIIFNALVLSYVSKHKEYFPN